MNGKSRLFFSLIFLFHFQSFAQVGASLPKSLQSKPMVNVPVLDSLSLDRVIAVSHDALENLYFVTANGQLIKCNVHLKIEQQHTSVAIPAITSLEAAQSLKVFAFYQSSQRFQFFDRFLTPSQTNTVQTETLSHFNNATLSSDQMIWLFDEQNTQLIKYNPILEDVILKVDLRYFLPEKAQVRGMQEYGNRLYIWQNTEILVFDFIGNYLQKLPIDVETSFSFYRNQLYYPRGKSIFVYQLETMEQKKYDFSLRNDIKFAVKMEGKLIIVTDNQVKVFQFEP